MALPVVPTAAYLYGHDVRPLGAPARARNDGSRGGRLDLCPRRRRATARCSWRTVVLDRRPILAAFALTAAVAGDAAAAAAQEKSIVVFAAASMKNALDDVDAAFTKKTGIKVVASYAASSALMKQIEQGAPADVFSPPTSNGWTTARKTQLIKTDTRFNLLGNRLVLIAPKDSKIGDVRSRRASISPSSPATAASRPATCARSPPAFMPRPRWKSSAYGRRRSRKWRWPRTCAPRWFWSRAARRRSASSTRPTPRSSPA